MFFLKHVLPLLVISVLLGFVVGQLQFASSVDSDLAGNQDAESERAATQQGLSIAADHTDRVRGSGNATTSVETDEAPAQTHVDRVHQEIKEAVKGWSVDSLPQVANKTESPLPAGEVPERRIKADTARPARRTPQKASPATVMQVLDRLPCAATSASVNDGIVNVRGYVIERLDMKRLEGDLLALAGTRSVNADLKTLSEKMCGIVKLYAPYWAINSKAGQGASISTQGEAGEFAEGSALVVTILAPAYDSYVSIDYFSLDGEVVHMLPSRRANDHQAPANYVATIGDLDEWIVSMPFGTEMVTVLFTPRPLFRSPRDEQEPAAEYIAAVQEQLSLIAKESGKQQIIADFALVNTKPRSRFDGLRKALFH